jgi:glutaconate CoA-transferase, subunit B
MVAAASREILDGEIVFVGMRLPLIAFALAKRTHAPTAIGVFEAGLVREIPSPELLYTMADAPNVAHATWATGLWEVMSYLQRGEVDLGFIGGAEVDVFGNVNTSYIGWRDQPSVKLPGSGGATDIACLARRFVIIMEHDRRRLRQRVDFITSPGYGTGGSRRQREGLPGEGPSALITTLGVFSFRKGKAILSSYHPGATLEEIASNTDWPLETPGKLSETRQPSMDELRIIREYDPAGFWTSEG